MLKSKYNEKMLYLGCCLFVFVICISSCCNDDEMLLSHSINSIENDIPFNIEKCEKHEHVKNLFDEHFILGRGLSEDEFDLEEYDFNSTLKMDIKEKTENIYVVPSLNNSDLYLSGIEINGGMTYVFKLKEIEHNLYILYNELDEPLFDYTFNEKTQELVLTKVYNNDAIALPKSRVNWGSAICNVGLGTAMIISTSLTVPTLGASIGVVFCGYVLTSLIC